MSEVRFYSRVSTKAACDPVKTVFICAPQVDAIDEKHLEEFAERSGWIDALEDDGALLIMPVCDDWSQASVDLLTEIYQKNRNSFLAPGGKAIPGRNGIVWTWETLIYLVGYGEGADYAGQVLVKHPNMFAGTALIKGGPHDFSDGSLASDHWLIANPSADYCTRNSDVPSAVWFFGTYEGQKEAADYFCTINRSTNVQKKTITVNGTEKNVPIRLYADQKEATAQVGIVEGDLNEKEISSLTLHNFFNHIIRWKNSPDGTLGYLSGKYDFYHGDLYQHHEVTVNGLSYPYAVHLPAGKSNEELTNIPVVFSIHGRGEPAWLFAEKNGWNELADASGEFIAVYPDSPENIWSITRDRDSISSIIEDLTRFYSINRSRIYLTGFSNGAVFTCQQMTTFPYLFAAASPWNGPSMEACSRMDASMMGNYYFAPDFLASGYEMPVWLCVGDNDTKAGLDRSEELAVYLQADHCDATVVKVLDQSNYYTASNGYNDGSRFNTHLYSSHSQIPMVGYTVMKNMPHGAVKEESKAAWAFMRRFARHNQSKEISYTGE